jgi:hypothetical protein
LLLLAALLLASCSGSREPVRPLAPPPVLGEPDPADRRMRLTLPRLGGGRVSVEDFRGQPVILALFATWDLRSQAEAPYLQRLHQRLGPRGLKVLGVALGPVNRKGIPLVETYVEVMKLDYDILLAEPENLDLVAAVGPTRQVPRTLLLDREGRVVLDQMGRTDLQLLTRKVERMLNAGGR